MGNWPLPVLLPGVAVTISTMSRESVGGIKGIGSASSSTWDAANRAFYIPVRISQAILLAQFFVLNGATVSGNIDVGIYDIAGTKISSSGSTAQAGVNAIQTFNVTDIAIGPGLFYLAGSMNNTTGAVANSSLSSAVVGDKAMGCFMQNTAFPLPATWTIASDGRNFVPVIGISRATTI